MTLVALEQLISPPVAPIETRSLDGWLQVEEALGIQLPSDYKNYISIYGTGQIGGFLLILNPFSANPYMNLIKEAPRQLDALRVIKEAWGERECPYPLHPEPEGLLPWGYTDNGDGLFWQTVGESDQWPVVINESRGPKFEQFEGPMTSFLAKLVSGQVVSEIIPYRFINKDALFVPINFKPGV